MRAENTLNNSSGYLNGFNDVYQHKSPCSTLTGLLKVISYALIIPPIIAGWLYLQNKEICMLQREFDVKIDQIQTLFTGTLLFENKTKLANYLINKMVNFDTKDDLMLEQERFAKGFRQLGFDHQKVFFKMAHQFNCMETALQWIPSDIKELNFVSGGSNALCDSEENRKNVTLFIQELPRFGQLEKIELDLRGLGFYAPSVDKNVQYMTRNSGGFAFIAQDDRTTFHVNRANYFHFNETYQIVETVVALRALIHKQPNLLWSLKLMDYDLNGLGPEYSETSGNWYSSYSDNLMAYFKLGLK